MSTLGELQALFVTQAVTQGKEIKSKWLGDAKVTVLYLWLNAGFKHQNLAFFEKIPLYDYLNTKSSSLDRDMFILETELQVTVTATATAVEPLWVFVSYGEFKKQQQHSKSSEIILGHRKVSVSA